MRVNENEVLLKLKQLAPVPRALEADLPHSPDYLAPRTLPDFLKARARHPQAQLVAGCTDVGLWVTKQHRQFAQVLDITRVQELRVVEDYPHHIAIGAAVPLTEAFSALVHDRPHLQTFTQRFAGLPVRNSGTLGGNVANGSPIGDSMPLLIALGANIVLMRWSAGKIVHREMPLEALYTGYRQNVMRPDEVLAWIKVPKATPQEFSRVYKVSKRFEDDISSVCLALVVHVKGGKVVKASIGAGGVAATPVRARKTESALLGQAWTAATVQKAARVLQAEFSPISDMRASTSYRVEILGGLMQRFWLESQGQAQVSLEQLSGAEA
jgi:xanthine dehydrogenase small subunit